MDLMKLPLRGRRRQHGAVAVIVALVITTLVLMVGLVIDLGRLYVVKTELQNAADACALAAARELNDRGTGATSRTRAAGVTVGNRNMANLQSVEVAIQPEDIRFSAALNDVPGDAVTASTVYVHCHAHGSNPMRVAMLFMTLAGIEDRELWAVAVARLMGSQSFHGIPLAICTSSPGAANLGFTLGNWYSGRMEAGEAMTGNYDWITFSGDDSGGAHIGEMLAGPGMTGELPDRVDSGAGLKMGAVVAGWNVRFGLYEGSYRGDINLYPPDRTGFAYTPTQTIPGTTETIPGSWPAGSNAYNDYVNRKNVTHDPFDPQSLLDEKGKPYSQLPTPITSDQHASKGQDRRVALAPVIDCNAWAPNGKNMPVLDWACVLMLSPIVETSMQVQLEFRGLSSQGACASTGFPNGSGPPVPALVR